MMCLLVFNSSTKAITCKQILDMTGLPKHLVADHLVTLAHPTVAILLKRPDGKDLDDTNMFIINPKYKNPLRKVVVPVINGLVPVGAVQQGPDPLVLARRNMIDCAIVRIMKVRQSLKHAQLTAEVMSQLKNRFDPKSVLHLTSLLWRLASRVFVCVSFCMCALCRLLFCMHVLPSRQLALASLPCCTRTLAGRATSRSASTR